MFRMSASFSRFTRPHCPLPGARSNEAIIHTACGSRFNDPRPAISAGIAEPTTRGGCQARVFGRCTARFGFRCVRGTSFGSSSVQYKGGVFNMSLMPFHFFFILGYVQKQRYSSKKTRSKVCVLKVQLRSIQL